MTDISSVTQFFPKVAESSVGMTLASSIAAGATTVPLNNSATNYSDGDVVVFIVDPGTTNQQTFTGTMLGGSVTNVVWTRGTNVGHSNGATVVDYVTATGFDMVSKGIQKHANQDGSLKTSAVQAALNSSSASSPDWTVLATVPTVTATNPQNETQFTYSGVNYTDRLQLGTKLQIPRPGTTPTQSMSFVAADSQYASKTSSSNLPGLSTITNAITMEAWVYVNSFPHFMSVITWGSGSNVTNGAKLNINTNGQLSLEVHNGSNTLSSVSTQSVPLGEKIHIAGTVTIGGSVNLYINGALVPGTITNTLSSGNIAQATNLYLATSLANEYFDGYVQEARIWSVAQTAANIQKNRTVPLTGTETGLVFLAAGNGDFTDKTSYANNLTASGGAIATNAWSAFSANEYAVITGLSYTAGNTVATVYSGPYVIPNATLGTTAYSNGRSPYGFNGNKGLWQARSILRVNMNVAGAFQNTIYNIGSFQLWVPTGAWKLSWQGSFFAEAGSSTTANMKVALSTANNAATDLEFANEVVYMITNGSAMSTTSFRQKDVALTVGTPYYLVAWTSQPTDAGNIIQFNAAVGAVVITAECNYL